ncbi:DUF5802 family protein [Natronomonas sp. EA1]|uniref:DUF5802 family protein n=1 Tax=Natronomonas sp. EA1 TaxID=3421655 RepID=UPI003EBB79BF
MFEQFSSGYYLGRLYVEPGASEHAVIHEDIHERLNEALYATGEGIERLDNPLLMKVGQSHVPVLGAPEVPERTLSLPEATLERAGIRNAPTLSEVLLAKPEVAERFFEGTGF